MTFAERCALCQKLRDGYDAELLGLWQAQKGGWNKHERWFTDLDMQSRFEQGYREGREILMLEDAIKCAEPQLNAPAGQKGEP